MMRSSRTNSAAPVLLIAGVCALVLVPWAARAGGPYLVGGYMGLPGVPFTWNTVTPVPYRVDGGPFAQKPDGTVVLSNAVGVARVQAMFQVWQDVPTASITFTEAGAI